MKNRNTFLASAMFVIITLAFAGTAIAGKHKEFKKGYIKCAPNPNACTSAEITKINSIRSGALTSARTNLMLDDEDKWNAYKKWHTTTKTLKRKGGGDGPKTKWCMSADSDSKDWEYGAEIPTKAFSKNCGPCPKLYRSNCDPKKPRCTSMTDGLTVCNGKITPDDEECEEEEKENGEVECEECEECEEYEEREECPKCEASSSASGGGGCNFILDLLSTIALGIGAIALVIGLFVWRKKKENGKVTKKNTEVKK